jgi:putative membrane protein
MRINVTRYHRSSHRGPGGDESTAFHVIIKWLCLTAAVMVTAYLMDGIHVDGFANALGTAAVLGVLNVILRPILFVLTLPITILTLGLFTFILNALMLKIASGLIPGFSVVGFWTAVFGALVISIVNWILNTLIRDTEKPRRRHRGTYGGDDTIDMKKRNDHWE